MANMRDREKGNEMKGGEMKGGEMKGGEMKGREKERIQIIGGRIDKMNEG